MLAARPAHGYDLCRELDERLGSVWKLGKSRIYAILAGLERDGLVAHKRVSQESLPPKKVFFLTDEGREVFRRWTSAPVPSIRDMRLEFLTKLFFCREASSDAEAALLREQAAVCRRKLERLTDERDRCSTEIERQACDYRIGAARAAVVWLEGLM